MRDHRILVPSPISTAFGSVLTAGIHLSGYGVNRTGQLRNYPGGAFIFLTEGEGEYRDESGKTLAVKGGDLILVFPGFAHWYGPKKGQDWNEVYVAVEGPIFDPWFVGGVLSRDDPVIGLGSQMPIHAIWIQKWLEQFVRLQDPARRSQGVMALNGFLADLLLLNPAAEPEAESWLRRSTEALGRDFKHNIDLEKLSAELGMSYETFRKKFQQSTGVSPLRFRNEKKIEAAQNLMRYSPHLKSSQIALVLGFSDEFHFSKRFTEFAGVTPREFRKTLG